jgi:enoyl-CoA hydratase
MDSVLTTRDGKVLVVTINRPEVRNAVDSSTALALSQAFRDFDSDGRLHVAILTGTAGTFCAGADLREIAEGRRPPVDPSGTGPMGPTWLQLSKPVIAAVEGHAVAGGLELALWCDLRIAARDAVFGVFNRRWGVPLIDLGTVHLPRIIGHGRALDLILTGRAVAAEEALQMGLVNRLVEKAKRWKQPPSWPSLLLNFLNKECVAIGYLCMSSGHFRGKMRARMSCVAAWSQ